MGPRLESLFREFEASREAEGAKIALDIAKLLESVEEERAGIAGKKDEAEVHIRTALRERFTELLGSGIDENRVNAETALLLVKFDIHEELMRMGAHLENFRAAVLEEGAIGKKLDFICQELNREANTLASKNLQLEVQSAVIRIKDSLEKIREQLRNVE